MNWRELSAAFADSCRRPVSAKARDKLIPSKENSRHVNGNKTSIL